MTVDSIIISQIFDVLEMAATMNDESVECNEINEQIIPADTTLEDGEIYDIVELDGIEVWGQHQNVLEQQALSHLKLLTEESQNANSAENTHTESPTKNKVVNSFLDINNYLANQAKLQSNHTRKINNSASEKSKSIANKITELHTKKTISQHQHKKVKKDIEESNNLKANSPKQINKSNNESDSEYCPSEDYDSDDSLCISATFAENNGNKRKRKNQEKCDEIKDDGSLGSYNSRMKNYNENKIVFKDYVIQDNLKIDEQVWEKLYSYQQEGIKWLWNIHKQNVGGLLGDEMGLGKTVQIIVFLAALEYSQVKSYNGRYYGLGPSLIVCPATVIHQWVKHFHHWWPPFRVVLLHQSGSYNGNKIQLINDINKNNGILITTYESVLKYKGVLVEKKWHYLILDEGHKIRNPSAKVTIAVKHFRTPHKLILTGSPMQNNLQELWSLFDFIVPGKLGSQQAFMEYFANPITQGGYANATPTQETTALLIATSLKDMITPYMLRRTKEEVKDTIFLPSKSEQVLFCSLTDEQKDLYRGYLLSDHVGAILGRTGRSTSDNLRRANILVGITSLRKICNHPDLYLGEVQDPNGPNPDEVIPPENKFGYYKRSGKMIVVAALLKIWKQQRHRVLLFTQTRAMIEIFEDFLTEQNYRYLKMDGVTSVSNRQPLIDKFNQDESYLVFLLTTRVGGLGVNLTGADRVIIYDPDWNPATDTQARERAWRIGQLNQVTVYRLVSAGTIEEKMYQRQIWKQLLSNKILIDPKTKRFFKSSDLSELFSLQEHTDTNPETADIFKNSKVELDTVKKSKRQPEINSDIIFSEDKVEAMKLLAQQIAKNISQNSKVSEEKKEEILETPRPSPAELLAMNRKKMEVKPPPITNTIDDCQTSTSFTSALEVAERNSFVYHKKNKNKKTVQEETEIKNNKEKVKVDLSGKVDGEIIEGLVKTEFKKKEKTKKNVDTNQDNYVLQKLFSKKGVHTALQHDVILQSGNRDRNNLKVHYEAKKKADMALKALGKSRLNNWRW